MAHLTTEQRYTISCMLRQGKNQSEIAISISKHKSVVWREISRNKDQKIGIYRGESAHRKYTKRKKEKPKYNTIYTRSKELRPLQNQYQFQFTFRI